MEDDDKAVDLLLFLMLVGWLLSLIAAIVLFVVGMQMRHFVLIALGAVTTFVNVWTAFLAIELIAAEARRQKR
jgi:hypothetical protein